jgi:hypothetical protein
MSKLKTLGEHPYPWVCGFAVAAFVATMVFNTPKIQVAAGFAPFAVVYIAAQAIERFLEPLSEAAGTGAATKKDAKQDVAAKTSALNTVRAEGGDESLLALKQVEVANAKRNLSDADRQRVKYFWAISSIIGLVVSAILGLGLIQSVATVNGGEPSDFFRAVDVVITGLAIGAGTKPLHDLIEVIQETKKEKKQATAAT